MKRPTPGFTLIETLMVISIISVLMAILLPALARARETARTLVCGTRVRQMAMALNMYTQENKQWFFPWREDVTGGVRWWFGYEATPFLSEGHRILDRAQSRLWPYYEMTDSIEICPAFALYSGNYKPKYTTSFTTYGVSRALTEPGSVARLNQIDLPAKTLAFTDSAQINTWQAPASPGHPMFEQWFYVAAGEATTLYPHTGRAQVACLDGHVALGSPSSTPNPRFPEAPIARAPADFLLQAP